MSQSYRLKSGYTNIFEIKIMPPSHFITNAASCRFASVAPKCKLYTHASSDNGASSTAICSRNYAIHTDIIHAVFANCKDNIQMDLGGKAVIAIIGCYGYRGITLEDKGTVETLRMKEGCAAKRTPLYLEVLNRLFIHQVALPCPGVAHGLVNGDFGFPAKHGVRLGRLCPYLLDVAGTARPDLVRHFHACGTAE